MKCSFVVSNFLEELSSLLNKCLRSFTGSQVYCSSVVTCEIFGGKSFSLDKCTQLDIPYNLTAVGVGKIMLWGPSYFGDNGSSGDPSFQILGRAWSPGLPCEGTTPSTVFLVEVAVPWCHGPGLPSQLVLDSSFRVCSLPHLAEGQ